MATKKRFTAAFIQSVKPGEKIIELLDAEQAGLGLRVTALKEKPDGSKVGGVKSWTFRYKSPITGKDKRIAIGRANRENEMSLSQARDIASDYRKQIRNGIDPRQQIEVGKNEERQRQQELEKRATVREVGERYFEACLNGRHKPNADRPKREGTINLERGYFDRCVVPKFGNQKLEALTLDMVQEFIDHLSDKKSLGAARQSRVVLQSIFAYAERRKIIDISPMRLVTVAKHAPRERVLTDAELKTLWNALLPPLSIEGASISLPVSYSIRLAMVTMQRRSEITGMEIRELDFEKRTWTIPGTRTKNHKTHVVPLSDLAIELITLAIDQRSIDSVFVFPSPIETRAAPIRPLAMTRAFRNVRMALGLEDMHPHDLRRTAATNLTGEALGIPRFIVSKVLNHTSDTGNSAAVTGVYDQNEYLPQKRKALNAWAARLLEIVEDSEPASNVVSITRQA